MARRIDPRKALEALPECAIPKGLKQHNPGHVKHVYAFKKRMGTALGQLYKDFGPRNARYATDYFSQAISKLNKALNKPVRKSSKFKKVATMP